MEKEWAGKEWAYSGRLIHAYDILKKTESLWYAKPVLLPLLPRIWRFFPVNLKKRPFQEQ